MLQAPTLMIIGFIVMLHNAIWGVDSLISTFREVEAGAVLLAAYAMGIVVHEWLHGIGFTASGAPWKQIRFGVYKFTAYCQCDAAVPAAGFRWAVALPGMVLGLIPATAGLTFGWGWVTVFGALMTSAAVGDALILWALRSVPDGARIAYRPDIQRYEITH
jgi:hypothetical protein